MVMTAQDLLSLCQVQYDDLEVEGYGVVRVRRLQIKDTLAIEQVYLSADKVRPSALASEIVRLSVVDENGQSVFNEESILNAPSDFINATYDAIEAHRSHQLSLKAKNKAKK